MLADVPTEIAVAPEATIESGLKVAVAPAGSPSAANVTGPEYPLNIVSVPVYAAGLPGATVTADGDADSVKSPTLKE